MRRGLYVAILVLAGCGQFRSLQTGLSAPPPVTEQEGAVLVETLRLAYQPCPTPTATPTPAATSTPAGPAPAPPDCRVFKVPVAEDGGVRQFTEAGLTLSDLYCDRFFRSTNTSARRRRFARGAFNDAGALVAAALRFASAGQSALALSTAGFNATDSSFRNYDESFMVSADLSRVRRLVLAAQDAMKLSIRASQPQSYYAAQSSILRYAGLCSFLGMQDLLNASVTEAIEKVEAASKATPTPTPTPSPSPSPSATATPTPTPTATTTPAPTPTATATPLPAQPDHTIQPTSIVPAATPG